MYSFMISFRFITDVVFKSDVTMCASEQREKTVITSNGHIVDIRLSASPETTGTFLLRYEGERVCLLS